MWIANVTRHRLFNGRGKRHGAELPPGERNYTGTIAGKPVNVNITRFATLLMDITVMNLAISTRQ